MMAKNMSKKTLVFSFFAFFAGMFALFFAIIWFVDPFRLFHKPFMCENQVYSDMRYNAKWFIDEGDYDSVILGTSMLANTSNKEAGKLLGGKFINISIHGSTFAQRAILMDYALKKRSIKKILISLDRGYFLAGNLPVADAFDASRFDFLYGDESYLNFLKLYFNIDFIRKIFSFSCEEPANMDMPSNWMYKIKNINEATGIKNWAKKYENKDIMSALQVIAVATDAIKNNNTPSQVLNIEFFNKYKADIEKHLLSYARKYPQTEFILAIPPYSIANVSVQMNNSQGYFAMQKALVKYILEQNLKNVKIYAFDYMDFTFDINNYIDLGHYTPEINSKILDFIAKETGRLSLENLDFYSSEFEKAVKNFDLIEFYDNFLEEVKKQKEIDAKKM